jgi:hypothetical protein
VELLARVPPERLVEHVPLPLLWDRVIVPKIAAPHGFEPAPEPPDDTANAGAGAGKGVQPAPQGGSAQPEAAPKSPSANVTPPEEAGGQGDAAAEPSPPGKPGPAARGVAAEGSGGPASQGGAPPRETVPSTEAAAPTEGHSAVEDDSVSIELDEDWDEDTQRGVPLDSVRKAMRKAGRGGS